MLAGATSVLNPNAGLSRTPRPCGFWYYPGMVTSPVPRMPVQKIVSGGQTGVDQGALTAAMQLSLEHGGWCPRGRLSENGRIPDHFRLRETPSPEYWVRTEQNVVDSDATLILYRQQLSGGSALTWRMAAKHRRACQLVDLTLPTDPDGVRCWLREHAVRVLNVAGPRESSCPGIFDETRELLLAVFRDEKASIE